MRFVYEDEGQKHEFQLRQGEFKIGRDPSCDIATTNRSVSRRHIVVTVKGTTVMVRDENSGNGMFVNDVRMPEAVLKNGDVLRAGKFALTFQGEDDDRTIVGSVGGDQEGTMVDGGLPAAPPPPRKAPSASQREAAGHKTAPLDEVRDEIEKMAAAPPPPKKSKPVATAEPGPPAKLKVVKGMPASVRDLKGRFTLGTQDDNSLVLNGEGISRNHCEIVVKDGKWVIRDLASRNGTWVNGKKVDEHVLVDGDAIQIGSVGMAFASTASSPAAAAVPPGSAREAAAAPAPPSKTAASPADAAARKKKLVIAAVAVGLLAVVGFLATMKTPEEGGGNGQQPGGGQSSAAKFEEDATAAWGAVLEAMQNREYKGASEALTTVRSVYKKFQQDEAEVKAWAKVIDAFLAAGPKCVNLNGQGWDDLKATLEAAAAAGPFMAEYATDRAGWCDRCKKVWAEISQGQDAESAKKWGEAVAHYKTVDENHSIYGETAKQALKNAIEQWKKDYLDKLNRFDNAGDYEQCVATHKAMVRDIPETKNDRKLFERRERWEKNVDASRLKRAAEQLLGQGKYQEALKQIDAASTNDEKLLAELNKLRAQAEAGGTMAEVNKLYKEGKADEALARLGEVSEGILAQLKQKITKVMDAYKNAMAAEERKDYATAKRWWNEIVSSEEDRENFYRLAAEQKAGFDPTSKAADLTQQADAKMSVDDYVAARELAEQALTYAPGYEAARRIVDLIVKEAESRYRMLYAGWKNMPVDEALKKAQEIKAMFRASDGKSWKGVNDLIERIQKESDK